MYLSNDQVVSMYKSGFSLMEIQKVDKYTPRLEEIAQLLIAENVWEEIEPPKKRTRKSFPAGEICARYLDGKNLAELGRLFGTSPQTIKMILMDEGTFIGKPTIRLTDEDKQEISLQYRHGASLETLRIRFYTSAPSIARVLYELDVPMRKRGRPVVFKADELKLRRMYESGVCVAELAQDYKVPESMVRGALKRAGTFMRPAGTRGAYENRFKVG